MTTKESDDISVSVIVSTYNRPDALAVCLRSIFRQTRLPLEIIIGDDGSRPDTAETIKELAEESPVPVRHVWQPDEGFRLGASRNKSVAAATGQYIIELDGDVFIHPRLIEDHLALAARGCYVKGVRVNLNKELTEDICLARRPRPIGLLTRGIETKRLNTLRVPAVSRLLADRYRRHRSSALGCNMSFWRDDFLAINGYDEFYEGWGGEDWDLGNRLQRNGVRKRYLKFSGAVFHLWHPDKYMYNKDRNFDHLGRPESETPVRCVDGVDKYL